MELTDIHSPADIKLLPVSDLPALADKLRSALLNKLSLHGGHIGPNLGMVEATLALHYVFNSPVDKIVYDVSHQSYVHKMLTGRMEAFLNPDDFDMVSGYTNPVESPHDFFTIGHTSTSIALAGGLAKARNLRGDKENIIAVIGDGSLSGGEAFEGLDYGATLNSNFIVVVNDNDMSIAENHGGLYDNLRLLRETDGQAPCNYFKSLGYDYRYVAYGNDVEALVKAFEEVKDIDHPVVVHIATQKGKGYAPAEADRERFHYGAPFEMSTGNPRETDETPDYNSITCHHLMKMMGDDPTVVAITAGTPAVMGFTPENRRQAGKQFVDVGIAEQDAVALASGIARGGGKPFFGVYSTFIQRAYDQIAQDVAINSTPVVIGVFMGTVMGMNDVTHLGWFDIALLGNIPNFVYLAPTCKEEYISMLDWAMKQSQYPVGIRVPDPEVVETGVKFPADYSEIDRFDMTHKGSEVAIIAVGNMYVMGKEVLRKLSDKNIEATLINPRFVSGIDRPMLTELEKDHRLVVTIEDGILSGGFGEKVAGFLGTSGMSVKCYGLEKQFSDRYSAKEVMTEAHLDPALITIDILELLQK